MPPSYSYLQVRCVCPWTAASTAGFCFLGRRRDCEICRVVFPTKHCPRPTSNSNPTHRLHPHLTRNLLPNSPTLHPNPRSVPNPNPNPDLKSAALRHALLLEERGLQLERATAQLRQKEEEEGLLKSELRRLGEASVADR